jgi:hypothetical protein
MGSGKRSNYIAAQRNKLRNLRIVSRWVSAEFRNRGEKNTYIADGTGHAAFRL